MKNAQIWVKMFVKHGLNENGEELGEGKEAFCSLLRIRLAWLMIEEDVMA